ncbi:hypothetical protein JRI60_07975 [Archangium violaceum]|nr:hypothetical protein JRI60_07975 [Archangium violaceum]
MTERLDQDGRVRLAVYGHFIDTGARPGVGDLSQRLGLSPEAVKDSLRRLGSQRVLVLEEGSTDIRMAMPFSGVPTGYRVETPLGGWWANCAWDALGIAAMLQVTARVETRCEDCGDALTVRVEQERLTRSEGVIHFAVPAARWWEDICFT